MGKDVVQKYVEHANTPHGRLRHDLLFMYYDEFMKDRDIDRILDIGGGSGFLVQRLLEKYPDLKAVIVDADKEMIELAGTRLAPYLSNQRLGLALGRVEDFPRIYQSLSIEDEKILTTFNHTIEYVEDKMGALAALRSTTPAGSFLGIMYLNNSHEALRQLIFKDSPDGVLDQLQSYSLDMIYFGMAQAVGTAELERYFADNDCKLLREFGIRCLSDFKPRDFVDKNYDRILNMEFSLGKMRDFIGLARYRLKIFGI
jgi:SAM-dependent methyltransferase